MEKRITRSETGASIMQNIAGAFTPIFKYDVGGGEVLQLVEEGPEKAKLLAKLYKADGEQIADGELVLAILPPDRKLPFEASYTPYSLYHEMTLAEQSNKDNEDFVAVALHKEGEVLPDDQLWVMLRSQDVVDWTKGSQIVVVCGKLVA